ncbi:ABC transporter ATP-binding protein [Taibaiella lutea]|uniref:ABC transporter ATP-binding protein n=1 Tax=Taibaiella lutea TaxID=2608001 RepID=UPI00167FDED7|nr:ABC transporter ATP-binding protein [Taibaiella lutea]
MSYSIQIENLRKHYPGAENTALQGLSLNFKKGIIAGLLGPNGAGKTTTISIICGLVKADSGLAKVLELDCSNDIIEIKKKIGVVPQQFALYPQLTGKENLEYVGRLYNIPSKSLKGKVSEMLAHFGLEKHANKRVSQYSGGMKRRANIIAGLLHNPELLILDEPTAGVDVQSRNMILDFLKQYNVQGNTIIYTSHLLEEAEKICDDVAIIDEGKLIAQASPKQLIASAEGCNSLEDVFLFYTGRTVRE